MPNIADKLDLLRWAIHYEGIPFAFFRLAVKSLSLVGVKGTNSAWFQKLAEERFDNRFNVATRGIVELDELSIPDDLKSHAVEYAPTSTHRLGWLLSRLGIDFREFEFVDFGSGKGRVLLIASEFPFQRVRGVELAHELHDISIQNIQTFRSTKRQCDDVQSCNQSATEFEFSKSPLVIFFFNPFSAEILQSVLNNLKKSLEAHPRHVIVLYYNALHANVFRDSSIFFELNLDVEPGSDWALFETRTNT